MTGSSHHVPLRMIVPICGAIGLTGCGPTASEMGMAALTCAPVVLLVCYALPMLYQLIMRRAVVPDVATIIVNVCACVGLVMLASWSFDLLPEGKRGLILIVCGCATLSLVSFTQFGWLVWCYKHPHRRVSPVVLGVFALCYVMPAWCAALELGILANDDMEMMLIVVWLLPGLYGLSTCFFFILCVSLAIVRRRKDASEDGSLARTAQIFD